MMSWKQEEDDIAAAEASTATISAKTMMLACSVLKFRHATTTTNSKYCLHDLTTESLQMDNVITFKQTKVLKDCLQREGIQKVGGGRR